MDDDIYNDNKSFQFEFMFNFEILVENLLNIDNNLRKVSEKKLFDMYNEDLSKVTFILLQTLLNSRKNSVRQLCCTILNNVFNISKNENSLKNWNKVENKKEFKVILLNSYINEQSFLIKKNIADLITSICEILFDNDEEEKWKDIILLISKSFQIELNDNIENYTINNLEVNLYLFSKIYVVYYDDFKNDLDNIIITFKKYFKANFIVLKLEACEAIVEILYNVNKKDKKKLHNFILDIFQTTIMCFNENNQENIKKCLFSISGLSSSIPNILIKHFSDLFILMGNIIDKVELENSIKEIAFDIIISIIEKKPKLLKDDKIKLNIFLKSIINYSLCFNDFIDDTWMNPVSQTYSEENIIEEEPIESALVFIDRLYKSIGFEEVMKTFSPLILEMININVSENKHMWKYQYFGYISISNLIKIVKEFSSIENIINSIIENLNNENIKIKYACLECIQEISDKFQPLFQNSYHEILLPKLINMLNDKYLRIKLQTSETLQAFIEHCHSEKIFNNKNQYLNNIIEILLINFIDKNSSIIYKEAILNLLTEITVVADEYILIYYEKLFSTMLNFLSFILENELFHNNCNILNSTIEFIIILGPKNPKIYNTYISNLTKYIIQIQNKIETTIDPIFKSIKIAWEDLIHRIIEIDLNLIYEILNSILIKIQNIPKIFNKTINETLVENDYSFLFKCLNEKQTIPNKNIKMCETSDVAGALEILNKILEKGGLYVYKYIEDIEKVVIPLLDFGFNSEVRLEASNSIVEITKIIISINKNNYSNFDNNIPIKLKNYISYIFKSIQIENEYDVISNNLDNIGSIFEIYEKPFLSTFELNELYNELILIFEKIERFRKLAFEKDAELKKENEINEENDSLEELESENNDLEEEIENEIEDLEDILTAIADLFASIFKTHNKDSISIVEKLQKDILPKFLSNQNSSIFEIKLGLFIINDFCQYLGEKNLSQIWEEILKIILFFCNNNDNSIRQVAYFGLGVFSVNSINFSKFNQYIYEQIYSSYQIKKNCFKNEEDGIAKDNLCIALSKIIEVNIQINDNVYTILRNWIKFYINILPLGFDEDEILNGNEKFVYLSITNSKLFFGENNENILEIIILFLKLYKTKLIKDGIDIEIKNFIKNLLKIEEYRHYFDIILKNLEKQDIQLFNKLTTIIQE